MIEIIVSDERKKLSTFGYGLALLIPFLVLMHVLKGGLAHPALIFIAGIIAIMAISTKAAGWRPWKNAWIFLFQAAVVYKGILTGAGFIELSLAGLSVIILALTILRIEAIKPFYNVWMKAAAGIGMIVSGVVLSLIFFLVFGAVGLVLRLLRKDLLDQRFEPGKKSYWSRRTYVFDKENYKRQF